MKKIILIMLFNFSILNAQINIDNLKKTAEYNTECDGVSMLVMENGKIIFEDYPTKYHNSKPDSAWAIASGTKGFSGIIAAKLINDGLMSSYDELCSETISEWKQDSLKSKITIRQLLSLISGLDASYGQFIGYAKAIQAPMKYKPGEKWEYSSVAFQTFGEIVRRKLQKNGLGKDPINDFLKPRILDIIDSKPSGWQKSPEGDEMLPSGARFTAREWSKFGEFVRLNGNWNGSQLIRSELLDSLFIGSKVYPTYGISWWLDSGYPNPITGEIVMVLGAGGQNMYISRKLGLVVIRQTSSAFSPDSMSSVRQKKFKYNEFWDLILYGKEPTSVQENNYSVNNMIIYPNPVINEINLFDMNGINYTIYNCLGVLVKAGESSNGKIIVSDLSSGIYFLRLDNSISKFIKE
jgi:CubicO group peptidase (beta-lactamase class C family)